MIPRDAEALLASIQRSASNDNTVLVAGERALLASGMDPDSAARIAYGRFPVAGPARWSDDWLAPRFAGTTFRFHRGVDIAASLGTPLRSPADGTVDVYDDLFSGLSVMVKAADGTVYELAHMSAVAPGIERGITVRVGDPLGAVGQSGAATGPHLHLGIWLGGTQPVAPKPIIDQWVLDAAAKIDTVLRPAASAASLSSRPMLATALVRGAYEAAGPVPGDLLFATAANPTGGPVLLAEAAARQLGLQRDWRSEFRRDALARKEWDQALARAWRVVAPLSAAPLRNQLLAP